MTQPAAILFDLDGTLLTTGGAGRKAMDQALREVLHLPQGLGAMRLDGMTDRAIVREAVVAAGQPCDAPHIDAVIARYLELLEESVAQTPEYVVLPGVVPLLHALAAAGRQVGLGTGNVEPGARIKLSRGDLNGHFAFGGYGGDAEDRAEMLAIGAQRAAARLGRLLHPHEVFIVGDTPKDVAAGKKIGARVLAVATGNYSLEALAACGPDAVVQDLTAPEVLSLLGG